MLWRSWICQTHKWPCTIAFSREFNKYPCAVVSTFCCRVQVGAFAFWYPVVLCFILLWFPNVEDDLWFVQVLASYRRISSDSGGSAWSSGLHLETLQVEMCMTISRPSSPDRLWFMVCLMHAALPLRKQVQHYKNCRTILADVAGDKNASGIIRNALFVCGMGPNELVINYFSLLIRLAQMKIEQHLEFLLN